MHDQRWMFANLNETLFHKKWFSMPVVREWLAMQSVIKIDYVVNSYEHFQELLTGGRTQIVIIVQTQGSCNSTILKLPLENGILVQ